jgi:anhydro-N-acetylmuramic acid kinase
LFAVSPPTASDFSQPPARLVAGAMSGTSADGIDVAITEVAGRGLGMCAKLVLHHHRAYDPALRAAIFAVRGPDQRISLAELARLGREISLSYAAAVNEAMLAAHLTARDIAAVAAHGQTLYHAPPNTVQWLDPALIAAETGCRVVSDFRRADCAAGGEGAPLVPFADWLLFQHPHKSRILLNIGGIANVTWLPAGAPLDEVLAFDAGPGNCVSDWLMRTYEPDGPGYDAGGQRASEGAILVDVVDAVLRDPFFTRPPPKSTDGPAMIAAWNSAVGTRHFALNDLLATACWLTAEAIALAAEQFIPRYPEVIISGGGTRNLRLMELLTKPLFGSPLPHQPKFIATDELGVPSEAKEALAFALLAVATLDNEPSNVPSATGARRRVVLGSVTPKP